MKYSEVLDEILSLAHDQTRSNVPGDNSILRMKYALSLLGDPQENYKCVHIAGTSGKGSSAYMISKLLSKHGFKVGLTMSPHVIDLRERIQINNRYIPKMKMVRIYKELKPLLEYFKLNKGFGPLSYFELITIIAYISFKQEKVDYAVIETGLGGTWDATNVINNALKVSVITRIGMDHTQILGNNIKSITANKAGIINKDGHVLFLKQDDEINRVIKERIKEMSATFTEVQPLKNIRDGKGEWGNEIINIGLYGDHQLENAGLALSTVTHLSNRDGFILEINKIKEALQTSSLIGRFDIKKLKGIKKSVIMDGAHNPQKIEALVNALNKYTKDKIIFIIAFKKNKDIESSLRYVIPKALHILITDFNEGNKDLPASFEPREIEKILIEMGCSTYTLTYNIKEAIGIIKRKYHNEHIVITGSFYLIYRAIELIKNDI